MVLYPPETFDENEIFIIITLLIVWGAIFVVPKHLRSIEILLIWTLNVFFVFTADMILAVPPLDLYDSNDLMEFEIFDMLIFFLGYPPFAYLALNYYKTRKFSRIGIAFFILVCALVTTVFEWVAVLFDVFTFKDWNSFLSFLVYILVYGLNVLLLTYINKKLPHKHSR